MKKKLYLSATTIKTYLECKQKFKFKYIQRLGTGEPQKNKYLSFGNSIHLALADFNMIKDSSYRTLDILHNLLRKNWIREGYESIDEEREFGLRGLSLLTNYFNRPLDTSRESLLIEEMIYKDMNEYVLCGKLDKVFVRDDGETEILDYKTSNIITPIDNIQLPLYLILCEEELGYYPVAVSLYYLSQGKKITQDVDEVYVKRSTKDIYTLCEAISSEEYFEPNPSLYCKSTCSYYSICGSAKDSNLIVLSSLRAFEDENEIETVF